MAVMQTASPVQWRWFSRVPKRPGLSAAVACRDGKYVSLLVRPDRFDGFLAWADAVGIDHGMTSDDWRWARLDSPRRNNPVSETTLKLAAALTRDEFVDGALEADIICLPVLDFPDLEAHDQYRSNDQFSTVTHAGVRAELHYVRSPVDAMADGIELRAAPELGADQALLSALASATDASRIRGTAASGCRADRESGRRALRLAHRRFRPGCWPRPSVRACWRASEPR